MRSNRSNSSKSFGNTNETLSGKKSQDSPSCHWNFTLNNWTVPEYSEFESWCKAECDIYIIGKEKGEEGTPHLQGYFKLKKKQRLTSLKKVNKRAHYEKARDAQKSFDYCMKDGDFVTNKKMHRKIKFPNFDLKWEIDILNLISSEPDDRTIYWLWSENGSVGKTTFVKYLCLEKGCRVLPEKKNDAYHAICELLKNDIFFDSFIFDIPRSSLDYINYGVIEKVKDGCFYSGKYEGGQCIYPCPHVICFANELPDESAMSKDRWVIINIDPAK